MNLMGGGHAIGYFISNYNIKIMQWHKINQRMIVFTVMKTNQFQCLHNLNTIFKIIEQKRKGSFQKRNYEEWTYIYIFKR